MTKLKKAQNFIKENGIDSDEYVSKNIEYFMSGGDPDDNSISLYNEHQEMLKIIIEAGLKVGQIEPQVIPKIAEMESVKYLRDLINLNDDINIKSRLMHLQRILENDLQKLIDSNFSE